MGDEERHLLLAEELQTSPAQEAVQKLKSESLSDAIKALQEVNPTKAGEVLETSGIAYAAELVANLPPDDAADIIGEMDHQRRITIIDRLSEEDASDIIKLLKYPPESAGGIMTTDFISFSPETTVGEALSYLRSTYQNAETVYYAYILGPKQGLLGTVSLKEMTLADPETQLGDIMETDVRSVPVEMDREEVARIFDRHRFQALPVVEESEMKGIVTFDDIIDVIREEATEDVQKMAGGAGNEQIFSKWNFKVRKRVPWLYLNLVAAFLAAGVVSYFEGTIAQITILAAFLPIINNQAGNTGMQALSVTIRGQATGEMDYSRIFTAIGKEIVTGTVNGLLIGSVIGIVAFMWQADMLLGGVIFIAMFLTIIISSLAGFLVPVSLERLGYDPAMASGIFVTAIADIAGILFLLGLATVYLTGL